MGERAVVAGPVLEAEPRDVDHVLHLEADGAEPRLLLELGRAGETDARVTDFAGTETEFRREARVAESVTGVRLQKICRL